VLDEGQHLAPWQSSGEVLLVLITSRLAPAFQLEHKHALVWGLQQPL
jgi:hypothetical protein